MENCYVEDFWGSPPYRSLSHAVTIAEEHLDQAVIRRCVFLNNDGGAVQGGRIYDSRFEGNAARDGGAVRGAVSIVNSHFEGNSAEFGGAVHGEYAAERGLPTVVRDSVFEGNSALEDGGAVYGVQQIRNSRFIGNVADGRGGAVQDRTLSRGEPVADTHISDSFFAENAAAHGGAIAVHRNGRITNSVFVDNEASDRGGALLARHHTTGMYQEVVVAVAVVNCTFTGNIAGERGGALFTWGSRPGGDIRGIAHLFVLNSIVRGNSEPQIPDQEHAPWRFVHGILEGGGGTRAVLDADPLFENPDEWDFRLTAESPARNAGTAEEVFEWTRRTRPPRPETVPVQAPDRDRLGHERPWDGGYDLGAYEYGSQPPERSTPDLTGLNPEDAGAALAEADLEVGEVTEEYSTDVPRGAVLSMSVAAGEVLAPGTAVDLVISLGRKGDVNGDGAVTAQDVQLMIRAVLGESVPEGPEYKYVFSGSDNKVRPDAVDVQIVINAALGVQ